jgi:hypothetical protein
MKYLQVLIYHDEYADDKWVIINKLLYFIMISVKLLAFPSLLTPFVLCSFVLHETYGVNYARVLQYINAITIVSLYQNRDYRWKTGDNNVY